MMRTLVGVMIALSIPASVFAQSTCATTASISHQPFVPPIPFRAVLDRGMFWYGSAGLWTKLREDGHWLGPIRPEADRPYRNKLPLFRSGFDGQREHTPPVAVTARRTDEASPAITVALAHGVFDDDIGSFIMTSLDLPVGCWRLEAQYRNETALTFVVTVP